MLEEQYENEKGYFFSNFNFFFANEFPLHKYRSNMKTQKYNFSFQLEKNITSPAIELLLHKYINN